MATSTNDRSIEDVHPDDLKHYTQCHFFAGIGAWSLSLRRAGWPDDRPVWTGSCPCQPFSQAGEGAGFDDPRHLWPHFAWLIRQRRPGEVLGEQVASKDAEPWLDLVQADLEAMEYAFGAIALPSAGIGAPHIRDRAYWVANSNCMRLEQEALAGIHNTEHHAEPCGGAERMADSDGGHSSSEREQHGRQLGLHPEDRGHLRPNHRGARGEPSGRLERTGAVNGFWADADWIFCRDGKWRPVEPGTFPLAHGAPSRVGRLRAYGNAINAEAATQFIAAYLDATS
ncbi:TPA: DNA cytosine methyltransferase [Pseudomonas aeruginosa]